MALTFSVAGSNTETGSSASLSVTGINANVSDWLVVLISCDNSGTSGAAPTVACSDTGGNTYTSRSNNNKTGGTVNDGVLNRSFTAPVTTAMASGSVTVTFSPNTSSKVIVVYRIQPGVGESVAYGTNNGATGTSTTPTITSSSITNGHTILGFIGAETHETISSDSDTSNGSWSTQQTNTADTNDPINRATTSIRQVSQYKTVTATALQTYNGTIANSRDWAANWMSFSATTNPTWGGLLATTRNRLVL